MSKYLEELQELVAAEERIREKRQALLGKRKAGVSLLLERLGEEVLALPDVLIAGLLLSAASLSAERQEELSQLGSRFLRKKYAAKATKEMASST